MLRLNMNGKKSTAVILALAVILTAGKAIGQTDSVLTPSTKAAPVIFAKDTLFFLNANLGPFTARERAAAITDRLKRLSKHGPYSADSLIVSDSDASTNILAGDMILMSITDSDAASAGLTRLELANLDLRKIKVAVDKEISRTSLKSILISILLSILATVIFIILLKLLSVLKRKLSVKVESWRGTRIRAIKIQKIEFLSANQITDFIKGMIRLLRIAAVIILFYLYLPIVFSFFPWTRGLAITIFGYILDPLKKVGQSLIAFLPDLFMIVVIFIVTRYLLKFLRFLFNEIGKGRITIPGFYAEWAEATYKIARLLVIAFAAVVVFPYLPGSNQPAFRGVSIFVGLLFSLGSASAVANMIAGLVITYMRPFKIGDRVKIADTIGDVIEKSLLVTRIKTIKNEDITIPNGLVLASHIINYSSSASDLGLILHTSVTIGYDAPWEKVHELLILAAENTNNILKQPKPFVLQTSLDDFFVSYQINAYTNQPNIMADIYSELHQNIQDEFNRAGVEIMSPHYSALRDGNKTSIPVSHIPPNYTAPAFRLWPLSGLFGERRNDEGETNK
jgi:small-conductance mechanosensitive channel